MATSFVIILSLKSICITKLGFVLQLCVVVLFNLLIVRVFFVLKIEIEITQIVVLDMSVSLDQIALVFEVNNLASIFLRIQ